MLQKILIENWIYCLSFLHVCFFHLFELGQSPPSGHFWSPVPGWFYLYGDSVTWASIEEDSVHCFKKWLMYFKTISSFCSSQKYLFQNKLLKTVLGSIPLNAMSQYSLPGVCGLIILVCCLCNLLYIWCWGCQNTFARRDTLFGGYSSLSSGRFRAQLQNSHVCAGRCIWVECQ